MTSSALSCPTSRRCPTEARTPTGTRAPGPGVAPAGVTSYPAELRVASRWCRRVAASVDARRNSARAPLRPAAAAGGSRPGRCSAPTGQVVERQRVEVPADRHGRRRALGGVAAPPVGQHGEVPGAGGEPEHGVAAQQVEEGACLEVRRARRRRRREGRPHLAPAIEPRVGVQRGRPLDAQLVRRARDVCGDRFAEPARGVGLALGRGAEQPVGGGHGEHVAGLARRRAAGVGVEEVEDARPHEERLRGGDRGRGRGGLPRAGAGEERRFVAVVELRQRAMGRPRIGGVERLAHEVVRRGAGTLGELRRPGVEHSTSVGRPLKERVWRWSRRCSERSGVRQSAGSPITRTPLASAPVA